MRSSRQRLGLFAALTVVGAFVACDLNPQPLPPLDPENQATGGMDSGTLGARDASAGTKDPEFPDGGTQPTNDGGNGDTGDAGLGDAGDGGAEDAGEDAGDAG